MLDFFPVSVAIHLMIFCTHERTNIFQHGNRNSNSSKYHFKLKRLPEGNCHSMVRLECFPVTFCTSSSKCKHSCGKCHQNCTPSSKYLRGSLLFDFEFPPTMKDSLRFLASWQITSGKFYSTHIH